MTAVTTRPAAPEFTTLDRPAYHHPSKSGLVSIVVASGLIAFWAAVILVTISVPAGLVGIAIAIGAGLCDAAFNTPTAIDVDNGGVTLHYWRRTKRLPAAEVSVTHIVPRDKVIVTRRGKRRSVMQFRENRPQRAVRAFMAASIELISR